MDKKTNRISVAKFEKVYGKEEIIQVPLDGVEDTMIEITKTIQLKDVIEFVENVSASCVDMDSGEFMPQVRDFAIKKELLTRYANFTMPVNISKQYDFIYGTNVVDIVIQNINQLQFQEIVTSIDRKIKFMLDCITSIASSNTAKLVSKLETVTEQNSALFDSVGGEDISQILKDINSIANMDEEKIARAVKTIEDEKEE